MCLSKKKYDKGGMYKCNHSSAYDRYNISDKKSLLDLQKSNLFEILIQEFNKIEENWYKKKF